MGFQDSRFVFKEGSREDIDCCGDHRAVEHCEFYPAPDLEFDLVIVSFINDDILSVNLALAEQDNCYGRH